MKTVSAKNISFDRKPFSSGTPAIAALATIASVAVIGIALNKPLSRAMSRVPVSWSMTPAAMNSAALNVAWFMMWKTAATAASGLFEAEQQRDQAEMADRRIREQPLEVALEHRGIGAEQQRAEARRRRRSRTTPACRRAPATVAPAGTRRPSPSSPSAGRPIPAWAPPSRAAARTGTGTARSS